MFEQTSRQKIRRVKAHLELDLDTAVKDDKVFLQMCQQRKEAKENCHPLLEEAVTNEEKGSGT